MNILLSLQPIANKRDKSYSLTSRFRNRMRIMRQKSIAILSSIGMLVTTAIWGFAFVVVKDTVDSVPPVYMMAFRFTIATVGLVLLTFGRLKNLDGSTLIHGIIIGGCLFAAYLLQTVGIQYTTAGKNAFLTAVYVILVPLILWLLTRRFPGLHIIVAAVMSLVGIALLTLQEDLTVNRGDVMTLFCGVFFALQIIFIARYNATEDAILLTVLQLATAAILSWLCAPFLDGPIPLRALEERRVFLSILYLGLLSTLLAFLLQNICQKYTPVSVAAILLSLEAFFGVLFSWIFLDERMTAPMMAGCLILFVAIVLAETGFSWLSFRKRPSGRPQ